MLSQFTKELEGDITLSDFGPFPKNVYPVGRLDKDSEGLILLTNDKSLKNKISNPKFNFPKTYFVQVEGGPTKISLLKLSSGIIIQGVKTKTTEVELLEVEPRLPKRNPPIRIRKNIPTAWLKIILREGKNRQIRKMTASVGHPTLRLVRVAVGLFWVGNMKPGEIRKVSRNLIY